MFKGKPAAPTERPATPEQLYVNGGLGRTQEAVEGLWVHQGDVLRTYATEHATTPDLAIELPTGTGKTLPGLIIADWVRRGGERVAFATPTVQLAEQVVATARKEGVAVVQLTGSAHSWPTEDAAAYEAAQATAVITYNTVFNSHPKLFDPQVLIFDDAHSGDQFVGENYGIRINRQETTAYSAVLDALAPLLPPLLRERLRDDTADAGSHNAIRLLLPALDEAPLAALDEALRGLTGAHRWDYLMLRRVLASCCVYVTHSGVQVRPMIPPTFENQAFIGARQRIYLSATLGEGGELERSFGRMSITRMPLSSDTPPRSGRRLFVFPELVAGGNPDAVTKNVLKIVEKAVVLSQTSSEKAYATGLWLAPEGVPVFTVDHLRTTGLQSFIDAPRGVLSVANRYDGLDLPGRSCRVVILDGLPNSYSLQDRFLGERADAQAALAERVRTRVIQGAGRCTRGPNDFAVVIVRGADLTRYFSRQEVRSALDAELQAEVEFGWENSKDNTQLGVLELVTTFLEQGPIWRDQGESALAEFRRDATKVPPPGSQALDDIAGAEVEAWRLAAEEDWGAASAKLQQAARDVGQGGEATRGYRSILLFLAAAWLHMVTSSPAQSARVRDLVRQAEAASPRGTWLREMPQVGESRVEQLTGADAVAAAAVAAVMSKGLRVDRQQAAMAKMIAQLGQSEATGYEAGLSALGWLLGSEAFKPQGSGRSDSVWLWDHAMWLTFEAKSEEHESGTIALKYVRQANTQLDQLASDRKATVAPPDSRSFLVSPRATVDPEHAATANPNVYLVSPEKILSLAADAQAAWTELMTSALGQPDGASLRRLAAETLGQFGCLPTQVSDRLSGDRIRPWANE
ncbi:MAG TPA: DEAD/DEAH box helicase [Marmoricola sp.]|nr:DEAD/DEAH box helicase [Marmoricola sp.]